MSGLGLDLGISMKSRPGSSGGGGGATIPATQTVSFGAKTRVGFGGKPLGYTGAGTLTISGTNASHWQIDNRYHLVPKNGAGAYGSAPPTFAGPYTLTIGDGTVSSTVTVNMVAAKAHFREMTATPGGVNQDDPLANTPFGPPYASQLNYYTDTSPTLATGDHIVMRDGHLNPAGVTWYLSPHASYVGVVLTIESETVDATNNADGNPALQHGGKIGQLYPSPASAGSVYPWEFKNLQFTNDTGLHTLFQESSPFQMPGITLTNCFVGFGPSVSGATMSANSLYGISCSGLTVQGCRITNVADAFTGRSSTAHPASLLTNVFHHNFVDNINIDGVGWTITNNFIFDTVGLVIDHPDCMQLTGIGGGDPTNLSWATITGNIAMIDTGQKTQGIGFMDNQSSAGDFKGLVFENNISVMCGANGMMLGGQDNVSCRFNTVIGDVTRVASGVNFFTASPPTGTNLTADRNVSNGANFSSQSGTVTNTNAVTLAATTAAMDLMYPNLRAALIAGVTNRAAAIVAATPAALAQASGGALLADGSYAGALKSDGSWNRGPTTIRADATTPKADSSLVTVDHT